MNLGRNIKNWHLAGFAAVLHVAIVVVIYFVGQLNLFPATFDENGIGISFSLDSRFYRIEASHLARLLQELKPAEWWAFNAQPHVKLYSVFFAVFGPFTGFNIIGAEPLNLILYLLLLVATYLLARELFGSKTALTATSLVALWPSLLLHTTQMLRDPLFILFLLSLVLVLVISVARTLSLARGLLAAFGGISASVLLWLIRGDMWELIFLLLIVGVLTSAIRQLVERRFLIGNTLAGMILIFAGLLIPMFIPTYRQQDSSLEIIKEINVGSAKPQNLPQAEFGRAEPTSNMGLKKLAQRVGILRHKFIIQYPMAGSNIDTNSELVRPVDVVTYLPRALEIGLFAPFPNMWFKVGAQVGWQGRLLSGFETLCMYLMTGLALVTLVRNRRQLSVWLVLAIILLGCAALGYVVVNIGTLYRMRYGFWILLIMLGSHSLNSLITGRNSGFENSDGGGNNI